MGKLSVRVEALERPDREVDCLVAVAAGWDVRGAMKPLAEFAKTFGIEWVLEAATSRNSAYNTLPRYTASLDAAMSLVPEGYAVNSIRETTENEREDHTGDEPLPLWSVTLVRRDCTGYKNLKKFAVAFQHGDGNTAALALCAAALKCRGF